MADITCLRKDALPDAPDSPGITRHLAFGGEGFRVIRSQVDAGTVSGWHHHGEHDVYGYMVKGTIRFESGPGGSDVTIAGPGDFFHVPAGKVHRDVNPSDAEGQEVILFLRGSGPVVVNVEEPDPA
ncbi:MAG: cupin domain-containing protein [bacterium]